ncbi:alpha/beta hydrolase fold-1 domain-containing protein [Planoprotostelium fungivorum]|uniref:Alpha/beta hydrolase fold-1 domain-containing protein n=1 Tax=Planoprotostelium fungivorum TaxID=1890364 RepID=A0A2P6NCZ1_9EUKA|nr:alpha/beta hydrolase fold-1 domain-containing protein [Planoprotostelium fungivorum]
MTIRSTTGQSNAYKQFRGWVAQQKIVLDTWSSTPWKYYDYGPKDDDSIPLILIPGVAGTAEVYFKQMISLCPKGLRLLSVQPPDYSTYDGWCKGFDKFLSKFEFKKIHLFGSALGGYLAQVYAQYRPSTIQSLMLCNSFCDTTHYARNAPCVGMFPLMPEFMLKRLVLSNFSSTTSEPQIAESIDFMVEQLESLSGRDLSSRLTLNCTVVDLDPNRMTFDKRRILIIESLDDVSVPRKMREDLLKYYPDAKLAELKSGGNFSYLSRADEVNLHIQVHMRKWSVDSDSDPNDETRFTAVPKHLGKDEKVKREDTNRGKEEETYATKEETQRREEEVHTAEVEDRRQVEERGVEEYLRGEEEKQVEREEKVEREREEEKEETTLKVERRESRDKLSTSSIAPADVESVILTEAAPIATEPLGQKEEKRETKKGRKKTRSKIVLQTKAQESEADKIFGVSGQDNYLL